MVNFQLFGWENFAAALALVTITFQDLPPVFAGNLLALCSSTNKFNSAAGEIAGRTRGKGELRILPNPVSSLPLNVEIIDDHTNYQAEQKECEHVSGFSEKCDRGQDCKR